MTQPNTIRKLSDSELLKRLNTLSEKERSTTLEILLHLVEMDRRRLYLKRGHSSLFKYCTETLGYSDSAAGRRIRTARCIRKFPEIRVLLAQNEVNVCTVSMVAGILTRDNRKTLLREIRGKSQRQVTAVLTRYRPEHLIRDQVRPVAIMRSVPVDNCQSMQESAETESQRSSDAPSVSKWQEIYRRSGGKKSTTSGNPETAASTVSNGATVGLGEVIIEKKFALEFTVSPAFMKKLNEVKALLSNRYPAGIKLEQLFEAIIDEFIDRHSPKRKQARREKRKQKREAISAPRATVKCAQKPIRSNPDTSKKEPPRDYKRPLDKHTSEGPTNKRTRYISPATKDKVFTRDGGRCTYLGTNGKRCNSTWRLQIDHIKPYARGGTNSPSNLRLLCGRHNHIEAERIFGTGHMMRFARQE